MEIIKCKICGKIFFQIVNMTTSSDFEYDVYACKECNKKAKENSEEETKRYAKKTKTKNM